MNKKIIAIVVSIVAVLGLAFLVLPMGASADQVLTVGADPKDEVEKQALVDVSDAFTEETGIEVEIVYYQDMATELAADIAAGTEPMVYPASADVIGSYVSEGYIQPLSSTVDQSVSEQNESVMAPYIIDGEVYGVPMDFATAAMFINEDYLTAAGMTMEDIPTTSTEVTPFLEELQANLPEGVAPVVMGPWFGNVFYFVEAFGGTVYDETTGEATFANETTEAVLQQIIDWHEAGLVVFNDELGQGSTTDAFMNEQAVIFIDGSWNVQNIAQNSDVNMQVAPIPTINGQTVSKIHSTSWVASASNNEEEQAMAEEFISYITGAEGAAIYCGSKGSLTANTVAQENIEYDEVYDVFFDAANADVAPTHAWGTYSSIINNAFSNVYYPIITGELPLSALETAEAEANAEINNAKN